jgi:aminopeptidase N
MKLFILLLFPILSFGQNLFYSSEKYTRQDSLRGTINEERSWWDVLRYEITVQPNYENKTISGKNTIRFEVKAVGSKMQLDLQSPMNIDSVLYKTTQIQFRRDGNAFHLDFANEKLNDSIQSVDVFFSGKPREAINPPWDGGWIWKKDEKGRPWMSVACQGLGASVWYPCKDHQSDEPDKGASITMIISDALVGVSNGKCLGVKRYSEGLHSTTWEVVNPINSYNIVPYIGYYEHFGDIYQGEKGDLNCDFWVLDYEMEKAKVQFQQTNSMLKCFEHWFGPYPFYEDGYKLVQSPFLGMEHQSAVAYGNRFKNGYVGTDLSRTGWGLKWDYILVHESGHEWFGNNITSNDIADMWIHEAFTTFSETIYTTCQFGEKAGNEYNKGLRRAISNDKPIIGDYGVNEEGSGDMYYKGSCMIQIIRQLINDDEKFRQLLRGMNQKFYHKTVSTAEIEAYICSFAGMDLSKVFNQYLRTKNIPVLQYKIEDNVLSYRWTNCVKGFDLKLKLDDGTWFSPNEQWMDLDVKWSKKKKFVLDSSFLVEVQEYK